MSLVLALDIGTSGGRALIADADGRRVGSASRAWRYRTDADGFPELDPGTVWASLASAARDAVRSSLARPEAIAAVGVTSQRYAVVLTDSKGHVLYAGPNTDARGVREGIDLERAHGGLIYETTGRLPALLYLPARLAWFRANKPEIADRTANALSFADWVSARLTGEIATDHTHAAEMLCYDLRKRDWSDALCDALGVPRRFLPRIVTEPVGTIPEAVAREFGLHAGTPVVRAGCDTQCAALGVGVVEPGDVAVPVGTTMPIEQVVGEVVLDEARRLWTSPHVVPGRYVLEAQCGEAGSAVDWVLQLLGASGDHAWLERAAAGAEPGSGGVMLVGPGPLNMGDFPMLRTGGIAFPLPLMVLGRSREDVARSSLEGIAYAARAAIEWLREVSPAQGEVAVCGGLSRSRTFVRILASVLGREVRRAREAQASALGACIVAAAAAGLHPGVVQAASRMSDQGETIRPDSSWLAIYDGLYQSWTSARASYEQTHMRVGDLAAAE
jgi:sugar (pentulose or hexulose) kinase